MQALINKLNLELWWIFQWMFWNSRAPIEVKIVWTNFILKRWNFLQNLFSESCCNHYLCCTMARLRWNEGLVLIKLCSKTIWGKKLLHQGKNYRLHVCIQTCTISSPRLERYADVVAAARSRYNEFFWVLFLLLE